LPLELLRGGAEQWQAKRDAGVADGEAGGEIVGAVDDEVVARQQVGGIG